jgi:DHA1 family multidrug resistance protein-like MFS transporter
MFALVVVIGFRIKPPVAHRAEGSEAHEQMDLGGFVSAARRIPSYLAIALITFTGVGFPMAIVKLFAEQQFKLSESAFGGLVLPAAVSMSLLSVPMSKVGERMGRARAVHVGLGLCMAGMAVIALGAILPFLRHPAVMAVAILPVGIGFLITIPAWMASVSDIDPRRRGVYLGAVMTAQGLGAMIGMPVGSMLYERMQPVGEALGLGADFGRYAPFIGCAACLMAGWLLSLKVLHTPVQPKAA